MMLWGMVVVVGVPAEAGLDALAVAVVPDPVWKTKENWLCLMGFR